ncbi:hypothetical protein [Oceanobacillus indicireducens]|uniref:DUF5050 domain-containing protein n=1 Tax=Oceanobacillus indicireducens TaxID=1004261 RepID=A0A918D158_9BACI|nr:hypothetical protein [Oceanobacillus indicireducens]GGN57040.1 hypothetical protein GCM10007971_17620 [Oceanobacillus indicireducens]
MLKKIKILTYPLMLLFILLLLSACGDDDTNEAEKSEPDDPDTADVEEDTGNDESNKSVTTGEAAFTALENLEATAITDGDFEAVMIEEGPSPNNYYHSIASNGLLIMEDNDTSLYMDYLEGTWGGLTTSIESLESDAEKGRITHSNNSYTEILDEKYYFISSLPIGDNEFDRENALLELDMESREIREILPEEGFNTIAKNGDTLFVGTDERIYAIDLETNEILWENDDGISSSWFPQFSLTDNNIVFSSWEILEVYSQETGELIYEDEGFFYDVATDGDMFYGLMNVSDYGDGEIQIISFHEEDGRQEELTEAAPIDHVYDENNVTLDLINNRFFVKVENGILAYDASSYDHLWTDAYGTIDDQDTNDDFSYYMYSAYSDDYIYIYTEALGSASTDSKNLFSVLDAATGEVLEHYHLGSDAAAGPFLDEATGKVMIYYNEGDTSTAYIRDIQ